MKNNLENSEDRFSVGKPLQHGDICLEVKGHVERVEKTPEGKVKVCGWVIVNPDITAEILIAVNGRIVKREVCGVDRPDVLAYFGLQTSINTGFEIEIPDEKIERVAFYAFSRDQAKLYPIQVNVPDVLPWNILSVEGVCPACKKRTFFTSTQTWLRDNLLCESCRSRPRDRHFMHCLDKYRPGWESQSIYEVAPGGSRIKKRAPNYMTSEFFPGSDQTWVNGVRNENIEALKFRSNIFDVVVCADVLEHIFNPEAAVREMARVCKKGGLVLFSTPVWDKPATVRRAALREDGTVDHLLPPEYHADPFFNSRCLVTHDFGQDLFDNARDWLKDLGSLVIDKDIVPEMGIMGAFPEIFVFQKF